MQIVFLEFASKIMFLVFRIWEIAHNLGHNQVKLIMNVHVLSDNGCHEMSAQNIISRQAELNGRQSVLNFGVQTVILVLNQIRQVCHFSLRQFCF